MHAKEGVEVRCSQDGGLGALSFFWKGPDGGPEVRGFEVCLRPNLRFFAVGGLK